MDGRAVAGRMPGPESNLFSSVYCRIFFGFEPPVFFSLLFPPRFPWAVNSPRFIVVFSIFNYICFSCSRKDFLSCHSSFHLHLSSFLWLC
jgi:hypothetical protein